MEPGQLYWGLVEKVAGSISIYDGPETFLRDYAAAPERNRTLFAAHWCVTEVCNGGFDQFFFNSTGVLAPEAAAAFETIGVPRLSALVRGAVALFGRDYPRDRNERQERLARLRESTDSNGGPFESFDEEFYRLLGVEAGGWESAADGFAQGSDNALERTREG